MQCVSYRHDWLNNSSGNLYVVLGVISIGFGLIATVVRVLVYQVFERQQCNTSCFFSSTLSPTASLAADARVLRLASLSLATSNVATLMEGFLARERDQELTLVAFFGGGGCATLNGLGDLVGGVPVRSKVNTTISFSE